MARIHRRTVQRDFNDLDNHNAVITHLEPDILECDFKWTLGSITMNKANGDDRIPAELFQILKDDAVKVLHSNSAVTTGLEKVSFHYSPKEGHTIALISHAIKVMLKIFQARLQ